MLDLLDGRTGGIDFMRRSVFRLGVPADCELSEMPTRLQSAAESEL
jgi:hypothetical protein